MIRTTMRLMPEGRRGGIVGWAVLTVLSVALRALGVVLLVPLVAALFGGTPLEAWPWVAALTVVTLAGWGVDATAARIGYGLGFALLDDAQHGIAERLTRVRLTWFTAERRAQARRAIAATGPDLVGLVVYLLTPLVSAVLLPIAIGLALLPISWPLGVAALAGVPVLLGALWAGGRITQRADRRVAARNSALTERIVEFARTQQALRAARRVEPARSHAGAALDAQHGALVRLLFLQIPGQLLFGLAAQVALVALAATTTVLAVTGGLRAPEAVALIVVIVRYLDPFTTLAELSAGLEHIRGTLRDVRAVLDAPVMAAGSVAMDLGAGPRIELDEVSFRYGDGPPVLDRLSLTLEPGEATALVGPSGSGKSTVLALVAGLQEPTSGRVLIDGVDAATLDPDARRAIAGVVFQHPYLFDGTVRANVLAGDPKADDGRVLRVLEVARVDELVARLPDGVDARVGEAGTALSGGERQRVAIARALLKPAPVLLIDEATSALDTENEAAVVRAIADDEQHRTRLIVAHRLSTIRGADRVVFLDGGRVVEDGGVDDLLAAGGRFAEFWEQQHVAARWRVAAL